MMQREFYVNLPSNAKPVSGTPNTTAVFRVHLPQEIKLTGSYECALVEIMLPHSWNNVNDTAITGEFNENEFDILSEKYGPYFVEIKADHYATVEALVSAMNISHEDTLMRKRKLNYEGMPEEVLCSFNYDKERNRVFYKTKEPITAYLSEQLKYILGFSERALDYSQFAKFPPDLRGGFDAIYIYCNIVEPQIVGDVKAPLLRILPVSGTYGEIIDRVFVHPHYVPVLTKEFSTIEISIKTDQNRPVPFNFGKTVVKLHFRRRSQL